VQRDRPGKASNVISRENAPAFPWHGFAVTQLDPGSHHADARAISAIATGWQVELSGTEAPACWGDFAQHLFFGERAGGDAYILAHDDARDGLYRGIAFENDVMIGALLVAPRPLDIARDWLAARLGTPLDPGERFRLLDGRPGGSFRPRGAIVCFCCHVGTNDIVDAIADGHTTLASIGTATRAGTNCGRCQPDITRMLAAGV
jgi:assimilatory nitrate reductase catalytic subunit